ncbi:MAG: hypothetical protein R8G66_07530 [Cytophagales bacterium]|nr:hypothetical protein [Cytophagales bacterium]
MILWLTLLLSIGAPYQKEAQKKEMATVIVYHQRGYSSTRFDLWLDNIPLAKPLRRNSSVTFQVPAGEISLLTKVRVKSPFLRNNHYLINVEAGNTYYLKADLEYVFPATRLSLEVSNSQEYAKVEARLEKIVISTGRSSKEHD